MLRIQSLYIPVIFSTLAIAATHMTIGKALSNHSILLARDCGTVDSQYIEKQE
jgi:hypothetical protein